MSKVVIYVLSIILFIYIYDTECFVHGSYFCL